MNEEWMDPEERAALVGVNLRVNDLAKTHPNVASRKYHAFEKVPDDVLTPHQRRFVPRLGARSEAREDGGGPAVMSTEVTHGDVIFNGGPLPDAIVPCTICGQARRSAVMFRNMPDPSTSARSASAARSSRRS
jgi:hypothetical protein